MEELKHCPFCGKNKCVRIRVYPSNDLTRIDLYSVVCDHVHGGCGSESGHYTTAENAIKAWNKRTLLTNFSKGKVETDEYIRMSHYVKECIQYTQDISSLPNCNTCGLKNCKYKPSWGSPVRINCPFWEESKKNLGVKQNENNK